MADTHAWFGIFHVSLYCLHAWHPTSEDTDTFHLSVPHEDGNIMTDDKEGIILALQHPGISSHLGHGFRLLVEV
jgi:hypothetical protein